ncbi:IPT/TIG domain-containing protein, partial [Burkholderia pseudomallei]|uniref:IPT/TIG domain-containing protein n=1 Tax=Burkholderia pseudomallei TaxID=28450 RepID=UPI0034DE42DA
MESQGNGRPVVDSGQDGLSVRERLRRQRDRWFRAGLIGLLGLLLAGGIVHAQSTRYVYDANGRVVAVTGSDGSSAQYGYNSLGYVSQSGAPIPAGQSAIFTFSPTHGVAGTNVTIQGQAFSSSPAGDTVTFNGVPASVISASNNHLSVVVPGGATTGPIAVTANGQTENSATSFTIDDTGAPPTITQVSPVVAVGGTVAVDGTHLYPVAGNTATQMGGVDMLSISSANDGELSYTVPSNAVSGHVAVTTPYGMATSATPVALLPSNVISAFSSVSSRYLTVNGPIINVGTHAAGQTAVLTFDAHQGDNLELTLNGITISGSNTNGVTVNVYSPTGVNMNIPYAGCSNSNPGAGCRLPLWNLAAGTYSVVVSPLDASATVSFNVILDADVVEPALVANTPSTVTLSAGQSERFTFQANAGDNAVLRLSGVSTSAPSGQSMWVQVWSPDAHLITGQNTFTSFNTTGSNTINLTNLPTAGTYTVVLSMPYGTPGNAQLTWGPGDGGVLSENGAAQSYQANVSGQNV